VAFRKDYIERLIEKLAHAIARALGIARSGRPDEGIAVVEDAIASGFGMPLPMLLKLTPATVSSLFGPERARLLAEALRAHAEMLRLAGRLDDSAASERLAGELEQRAATD